MNKEKQIIDSIKEKAYRVNKIARPVYGQGQYDMAYEILDSVQKIIYSGREDSCEGCAHEHDIKYDCQYCCRSYKDEYKKAGE